MSHPQTDMNRPCGIFGYNEDGAKTQETTDEELDFIINYDIKCRMGQDMEGDETK